MKLGLHSFDPLRIIKLTKLCVISPEVAQFLNLSIPECRAIVERYYEEEERELFRIREK